VFERDFLNMLNSWLCEILLPEYLRAFVTFGYKVGWRDQEIASLKWSNIDLQNGIVTLKAGETKRRSQDSVS
jgi:integrase